jgi:5-formyltetrahydrofolate cyclo-ligase
MLFLSLPDEIDTTLAIELAWQAGKTVAVPQVQWEDGTMTAVVLESLDDLRTDRYGLRMAGGQRLVPAGQIDLVVTPGLGFDRTGARLGRGSGFYDRFLANPDLRAVRCGLCFDEQVLERIPTDGSDQPVDVIVTDRQVIRIKKGV